MFPYRHTPSYTEADMDRAISLVKSGMGASAAANTYGIPRTSLIGRMCGRAPYTQHRSVGAHYRCWLCPAKFNSLAVLKTHVTTSPHTRLKVVCPFCTGSVLTFSQPGYLKRHVLRTHADKVGKLPRDFFTDRACYYLAVYPEDYKRVVKPINSNSSAAKTAIDLIFQWHETLLTPIKTMDAWLNQWQTHNASIPPGVQSLRRTAGTCEELPETRVKQDGQQDIFAVSTNLRSSGRMNTVSVDQVGGTHESIGAGARTTHASVGVGVNLTPPSTPPLSVQMSVLSSSTTVTTPSTKGKRDRSRHSCYTCYRRFESEADLRMHQRTHNTQRKLFKCTQCNKRFMYSSNYHSHQIACGSSSNNGNSTQTNTLCGICYASFDTLRDLKEHEKDHDSGKYQDHNTFPCDKCHMIFRTKATLTDHLTRHTLAAYSCPICKIPITRYFNLRSHIQNAHKISLEKLAEHGSDVAEQLIINKNMVNRIGAKPVICRVCWRGFERKESFRRHIEQHNKPKNKEHCRARDQFKCTMCDVEVDELMHLKYHVLCSHNEAATESNRFSHLQKLVHVNKIFNGTPYSLITLVPAKDFHGKPKVSDNLSSTGNTKTNNGKKSTKSTNYTGLSKDVVIPKALANSYKCDICGHQYGSRDSLVRHIKVHINASDKGTAKYTPMGSRAGYGKVGLLEQDVKYSALGEKGTDIDGVVYKCKICASEFENEHDLLQHIRELADYHCKYFFKKVSDLLFRNVEPTRKGLYWSCDMCGIFYTQHRSLYMHRRRKHKYLWTGEIVNGKIDLEQNRNTLVTQTKEHTSTERSVWDNLVSEADSTASGIPCSVGEIVVENAEELCDDPDTDSVVDPETQQMETTPTDTILNAATQPIATQTQPVYTEVSSDNIKIEVDFNEAVDDVGIDTQLEGFTSETTDTNMETENMSHASRAYIGSTVIYNEPEVSSICTDQELDDSVSDHNETPPINEKGCVIIDRMCLNCEENIVQGQPSLSCQLCCQTFCIKCSNLSKEVLLTLRRGPSTGLIWMCAVCRPNFPAYMGLLGQLAQFEDVLNTRFSHVVERLSTIEDNTEVLGNVIKDSNQI